MVEQWHSLVDHLSVSIQRMTLDHAMFFLIILMRDRYDERAGKFGVDLGDARCSWPENDPDDAEIKVGGNNDDAISASACSDGNGGAEDDDLDSTESLDEDASFHSFSDAEEHDECL